MKDLFVHDLPQFENREVTGYFVAGTRQVRSTRDGGAYLALSLCDKTGQIECRVWEMNNAAEFAQGDVIKIRGQVCRYQEKLQIKADKLRKAEPSEYELGDFVPRTTRDLAELKAEFKAFVQSFRNAYLAALLQSFLDDSVIAAALEEAPAAKSMHHAWIGGLLEHIVSLMGLCDAVAGQFPAINRDLLLTGAALHDIGKIRELRWGTSFDYTVEGQLLGHITIGIGMVEQKIAALSGFPPELRLLVLHMLLSHHGRYEFGSPKLPMTAEAMMLHYLDDLAAKMDTVQAELARSAAAGRAPGQMTDWVRSLERQLLDSAALLKPPEEV